MLTHLIWWVFYYLTLVWLSVMMWFMNTDKITNKCDMALRFITSMVLVLAVAIMAVVVVVPMVGDVVGLLKYIIYYFSIPTIILGVFLKLNQRYKWLISSAKRYMINNQYVDADILHNNTKLFFLFWPIYVPSVILYTIISEVYHRYLKNWFKIPTGFPPDE